MTKRELRAENTQLRLHVAGLEKAIEAYRQASRKQLTHLSKLRDENGGLNMTLFHVESGLSHPDEEIRLLIKAAHKAREKEQA